MGKPDDRPGRQPEQPSALCHGIALYITAYIIQTEPGGISRRRETIMRKSDSFIVEIETEENGYRVVRSKYYFMEHDKLYLLSIKKECEKWIKKGFISKSSKPTTITVIGHGCGNDFFEDSVFRIIVDVGCDATRTIVFGQDKKVSNYDSKKDLINSFDDLLQAVADKSI